MINQWSEWFISDVKWFENYTKNFDKSLTDFSDFWGNKIKHPGIFLLWIQVPDKNTFWVKSKILMKYKIYTRYFRKIFKDFLAR